MRLLFIVAVAVWAREALICMNPKLPTVHTYFRSGNQISAESVLGAEWWSGIISLTVYVSAIIGIAARWKDHVQLIVRCFRMEPASHHCRGAKAFADISSSRQWYDRPDTQPTGGMCENVGVFPHLLSHFSEKVRALRSNEKVCQNWATSIKLDADKYVGICK